MMRKLPLVLILLALVSPPARSVAAQTLPDTEAGSRVAAYLKAFNSGEPAMIEFINSHVSPEALQRRNLEERLQVYRQMLGNFGSLELRRVLQAQDSAVTVLLQDKRSAWFEFTFEFEPKPPHKLLGIRVVDTGPPAERAGKPVEASQTKITEGELLVALEASLKTLVQADEFSGVVLLAKNGKPVFHQAYGLASKEFNVPNRPDTKFNLGSINKSFTRLAIEQLVEKGRLTLDDTIGKHLPDYPNREAAQKVTIRHLLEMQGGIGDIFGPRFEATPKDRLRTVRDFLALFADQPPAFEPGSKREYSNGGYVVLGAIIEKVTGQSYYDYVREHIFKLAGMQNTDSLEADVPVPNLAMGYTRRGGGPWRNNIYSRPARGGPAGGGYSTAEDLLKYTVAMENGTLRRGQSGMGIAGGAPGINAVIEVHDSGYTAIVLANYDPPSAVQVGKLILGWLRRL